MAELDWIDEGLSVEGEETEAPLQPMEIIDQMRTAEGDKRDTLTQEFARVPLSIRHSANRKRTQEGTLSNLEHFYGKGNVFNVGEDNYAVLRGEGKPLLLEGAGSAWEELGADIVDILPEAAAGLLGAAGAAIGFGIGSVPGAAVGGGFGSYLGEKFLLAESEYQPGKDVRDESGVESLIRKEGEAITAGLTDVATLGVGRAVSPFIKNLKKFGLGRMMKKVGKTKAVDPGFETASEAGEAALRRTMDAPPLDVAEATLAAPALSKRAALRRAQPEMFAERELVRAREVTETLERGLKNLGPSLPAENVGNAVGMLQKTARAKIRKVHTPDIDATFDFVRRSLGDASVGRLQNTKDAITEILRSRGSHPELERLLKMIDGGSFTIKDVQNQLSNFGKGLIGHKRADKATTKHLFKVLADDLDVMADGLTQNAQTKTAGQMLRNARSLYSDMMQELEAVDDVMLQKVIKKLAPKADLGAIMPSQITKGHRLVQDLAGSNWDDAAVKKLVKTVDQLNPEVGNVLKRGVFDKLLEKTVGETGSESIAAGGKWFDPVKIHKQMSKPAVRKRMTALIGGDLKHPTMKALDALSELGQRIDAAGKAEMALGTPASKKEMLRMALGALAGGGVSGQPAGAAVGLIGIEAGTSALSKVLNRKSVAEVFLNPRAAGLLVDLIKPGAKRGPTYTALIARRLLSELGEEESEPTSEDEIAEARAQEDLRQATEWASVFTGGGKQ